MWAGRTHEVALDMCARRDASRVRAATRWPRMRVLVEAFMSRRTLVFVILSVAIAACDPVSSTAIDAPLAADAAIDGSLPGTARLTVIRAGAGAGRVTSAPVGIDCGTTCSESFAVGTVVTLTATPEAGGTFLGWGGACSGALPTCSISLNNDVAVDATFAVQQHAVTVTVTGSGSVLSTPFGIMCPDGCTTMVAHGTTLSFAATAGSGSTFLGWSGGCTGTGACSVTVDADVQLGAAFGQNQSLVVTRSGTGTGTVTSAPAGITCGTDCSEVYTAGTAVTLTPLASGDSVFMGWSGACSGTGACSVTVNAATSVNARFELRQYTLTATVAGNGTINTLSGTGIACPGDCTESYNSGAMTSVIATPAPDHVFSGWGGACSSMFGPCSVTMTQDRTVSARFEPTPTVTLTLSVYGSGSLRASPSPLSGPSTCSSTDPNTTTCTLTYNRDTAVLLTSSSSSPFRLVEIIGCLQSGSMCNLTMDASKTVSAFYCSSTGACPI